MAFDPVVLVAAVFGLVVGSFLNVVVARLPQGRGLHGRSACPACGAQIAWHDNVPVLSFIALRGRCRACGIAIPWRYPVIEVATSALFGIAALRFGLGPDLVIALVLLSALVAVTAIDLMHQIIPDVITLPGIVTGLVANVAIGRISWVESLIGIAVGGGIFFAIILVSGGGMGGGDMKLGAMLGAFLGWKITLLSILLAVVFGGALAVALLATGTKGRKEPIPFGPFLAGGGALGLLFGTRLLAWYMSAFAG